VVRPATRGADLLSFMVDIDFFKHVNAVHGHLAGDLVISEFARRLRSMLRTSDLVVHWGGEEFLILCRDSNRDESGPTCLHAPACFPASGAAAGGTGQRTVGHHPEHRRWAAV